RANLLRSRPGREAAALRAALCKTEVERGTSVIPAEPQQRRGPESILTGCGYGFRARACGAPRNDGREFRASAPRRPHQARTAHSRWVIVEGRQACGQSADKLLSIL